MKKHPVLSIAPRSPRRPIPGIWIRLRIGSGVLMVSLVVRNRSLPWARYQHHRGVCWIITLQPLGEIAWLPKMASQR